MNTQRITYCSLFSIMTLAVSGAQAQCVSFSLANAVVWDGNGYQLSAPDLNGDGRSDIVYSGENLYNSRIPSVFSVLSTSGGFQQVGLFQIWQTAYSMTCGDFNRDGKADVLYGGININISTSQNRLSLCMLNGTGGGGFATGSFAETWSEALAAAAGDFNRDGNMDVAVRGRNIWVSGDITQQSSIQVYWGNGAGGLTAGPHTMLPEYLQGLACADFNRDGIPDLAYVSTASQKVLIGSGTGGFGGGIPFALPAGGPAYGIAAGDFDGDGNADIATSQPNLIGVFRASANGSMQLASSIPIETDGRGIASGDFNGDRRVDLAFRRRMSPDHVAVLINSGSIGMTGSLQSKSTCIGGTTSLTVSPVGNGSFTFAWKKDGVLIDSNLNPTAMTPTLTINSATIADVGSYSCVISNICGSISSNSASISVCLADFNCSGMVDGDDVIAFFIDWDIGVMSGDVNQDGSVDGDDVIQFFENWDGGC